MVMVKFPC